MSEMIERVAKAAYESLFDGEWPDVGTSIDADGFRTAARAAIEAMREHLVQCANRDKEQAYYATIEEIEEALGKVDA